MAFTRPENDKTNPLATDRLPRYESEKPTGPATSTLAEGYTLMRQFPPGEAIVSMITFQGTALVATTKGVYRMMDGRFHPMSFVVLPDEPTACSHEWAPFAGGWGGINPPTHGCRKCGATERRTPDEGAGG